MVPFEQSQHTVAQSLADEQLSPADLLPSDENDAQPPFTATPRASLDVDDDEEDDDDVELPFGSPHAAKEKPRMKTKRNRMVPTFV